MQALFTKSYEFGSHQGLNLIEGEVISIASQNRSVKVPHIGWNEVFLKNLDNNLSKIFSKDLHGKNFYFIHSYIGLSKESKNINAEANYLGLTIPAIVSSGNVYGCQFHPEKSGKNGLLLLKNFCNL